MKTLSLILLLGWNVCVGQDTSRRFNICFGCGDTVQYKYDNSDAIKRAVMTADSIANSKTYGYIQFIADTIKEINFTIYIKGYRTWTPNDKDNYSYPQYFDLKGKQLFVQRFKKGKFLNFYQ